jgi:phosphatidate cytidylyltransferase
VRQRVISGVIGAAVLIAVLLSDKIILNIGVALAAFIALLEMYTAVGLAKNLPLKLLGLAASFAFTYAYSLDNKLLMPVMYLYISALFGLYMSGGNDLKLHDISKMFFITVYICFFLGHLVFIRRLELGRYLIWTVFIGAFLTDTFAYIVGKAFGKHALCPRLSPRKTVEGSAGGLAGCALGMVAYGVIMRFCFDLGVHYLNLILLGLVSSAAAQFGDLAASKIKRQYGIKDYGAVMPGHGGVMDRFDSVIFTAPVVYFMVTNLSVIFLR